MQDCIGAGVGMPWKGNFKATFEYKWINASQYIILVSYFVRQMAEVAGPRVVSRKLRRVRLLKAGRIGYGRRDRRGNNGLVFALKSTVLQATGKAALRPG